MLWPSLRLKIGLFLAFGMIVDCFVELEGILGIFLLMSLATLTSSVNGI